MVPVGDSLHFLTQWAVATITGLVAVMVFAANPRRSWNQWLALFLLLVCGNFAAQAVDSFLALREMQGTLPAGEAARLQHLWHRVAYVFLILDPAALAYFASVFPRRTAFAARRGGLLLLGVPSALFLAAELYGGNVNGAAGFLHPVRLLFFGYLATCYTFATWRILENFLREPSSVMATQLRVVSLGMMVAALPRVALLTFDLSAAFRAAGSGAPAWEASVRIFLLGALFALVWARVRWADVDLARRVEAQSILRTTGIFFAFFAAIWLAPLALEAYRWLQAGPPPALGAIPSYVHGTLVFSVRWFVFSGAILYGIVRYQILAVDVQSSGLAAIAFASIAGFFGLGGSTAVLGPWLGTALVGIPLVAGTFGAYTLLGGAKFTHRPAEYLRERSLEVYRAMLAAALADRVLSPQEQASLEDARKRLGITTREHETLLAIARAEESGPAQGLLVRGRYQLVRKLGVGGYATVHLARDLHHDALVVVKQISRDWVGSRAALETALRELEVARRVSHPNIVAVHEVTRTDEGALVVMEYVEGGSLRNRLERESRLEPRAVAGMLEQLLSALEAVHEAGVVHGDLKPENLLLGLDGTVKLTDFGTARALVPSRTLLRGTPREAPLGTIPYMAPEQFRGHRATAPSDLYAVGALAYEMFEGRPYVDMEGRSPYDILQEVMHRQTPRRGPHIPSEWDAWVRRALAPDPGDRFRTAAEMRGALEAIGSRGRSRSTPRAR